MSKAADARRAAAMAGAPKAYPSEGGVFKTAPKHRVTHSKGIRLRPFDDIVPAPELRKGGQKWHQPRDRDWTGKGVGCYHGTDPHTGKSILCEGQHCKFAPRNSARRRNTTETPKQRPSDKIAAVSAYLQSLGYHGPITRTVRNLTLDAITYEQQLQEMTAA